MKWKILFDGNIPLKKCGALGAGEVVSGWLSNYQAEQNVNRQIRVQQEENQKNRDWQTEQAELDRQFQSGQQNVAFGQQQQLQQQQQQYNLQSMAQQAKYNSPVYQRQQLEAAGISPQVYFGNHASFGGSSVASGGAPSAPSPAHGAMPGSVSGLSPVSYQPRALDIAAIGSAMKSFAEAKKLGVETEWLPRTLQADIMNKKSYADLNSALKLGAQINNEIQNAKVPYSIKQAAADLAKTISEAELNDQRKLTEFSQRKVNDSLQRLNDSLDKLNSKEYERYGIWLRYYENQLQEQLNNLRADTSAKYAGARESSASAEGQEFFNKLNSDERKSLASGIRAETNNAIKQGKLTESRQDLLHELTRKFELENDWYVANQILDRIQDLFSDVIDVKNLKVKSVPSESESSHSTEVKDRNGNTVYRQSNYRKSKKGKHK